MGELAAAIDQGFHLRPGQTHHQFEIETAREAAFAAGDDEHLGLFLGFVEAGVQGFQHRGVDGVGLAIIHGEDGDFVRDLDRGWSAHDGSP